MARRVAVLAVAVLLAGCAGEAPTAGNGEGAATCPGHADQTNVPYVDGAGPEQQLDLYFPIDATCGPVPLVVWVHGGGWRIGDKGNAMEAKVRQWTDAGWAVASVNYRLTDERAPAADRVMAPSHDEDVAAALAWLHANRADLGVDPDHIALVGHSAGAAIAAAVTVDPTYLGEHDLDPSSIACVAPLDTEGFDIPALVADGGAAATLYRSVFGDDPAVWDELSPSTHVGDAPVPDLFLVTRGSQARRAQVDAFSRAALDAGTTVTVVDLPGFSHEDVNKRIGDPTDTVLTPSLQLFLEDCLSS